MNDLSYALRGLTRNAGFTAVTVTTLALGIGANTAIFSVVDTVVFRPLPYREPARLVKICGSQPQHPQCDDDVSMPDFLDLRDQGRLFEQIAADDGRDFRLREATGSREYVLGALVTSNWLSTLGSRPMMGRDFTPEEEQAGRDRVAILSHAFWKRHFASDPHVLGRTLILDEVPLTVIGVLPPNVLRYGADFLRPLVPAEYPAARGHRDLDVLGRLKPGVTLPQARAEVATIARRLEREYPVTNTAWGLRLVPLGKYYASIPGKADQGLVLMLGAAGLVLLIACANVANLLLARAVTRRRECVIRAALGATRGRLVRQVLAESMLLFLMGGALGALLARWSVDGLVALAVAGGYVPGRMVVAIDGRVLAFSLLVSLLTGALIGLVPALQASRVDLNEGLRDSPPVLGGGGRRSRARRLLVVSELALSLVLLVGCGLLFRSFLRIHAVSGGFDPENLLETGADGGRSFPRAVAFWRAALERARATPGVKSAALTSRPPVHGARQQRFTIEGRPPAPEGDEPQGGDILVSPEYFETMGIPLLNGRVFTEKDDETAPPVVIVSSGLARRYFGGEDPIGRYVGFRERSPMSCCSTARPPEGVWREVIGVVGDVRQRNLDEDPAVTLYRPYSQIVEHDMYLMVRARSASDTASVATLLRSQLPAGEASGEWEGVRPMRQVIRESESIRLRRFVILLLGSFAGLALVLAAVGVYGVAAYTVVERTREIGVRMALGATRPVVFRQVLGETLTTAVAGLVLGSLAALALTRLISSMLFGVRLLDALTYLGVSFVLGGVVLLAGYLPARRATRVDPMTALRHE